MSTHSVDYGLPQRSQRAGSSSSKSSSSSPPASRSQGLGIGTIELGASTGHERQTSGSEAYEINRTPYMAQEPRTNPFWNESSPGSQRPDVLSRHSRFHSIDEGGAKSSERVFPMSSVVATNEQSNDGLQGPDSKASPDQIDEIEEHLVSIRFEHVETPDGHKIVTGRAEGIQRCEDEPIHMPGAVQQFGVLIAVELNDAGNMVVCQVSENSNRLLGLSPSYLFSLRSFTDILAPDQAAILRENVNLAIEDAEEDQDPSEIGPQIFSLSGWRNDQTPRLDGQRGWKCWCAVHHIKANRGLTILELEAEKDILYPLSDPNVKETGPDEKMGLAGDVLEPTAAELYESTHQASKPLKSLARIRKTNETSSMDLFSVLSQINEQFAIAPDLPSFLKIAVGCVKELTGFHRVMVYQFDEKWNGQVVAELVDWRATKDLYRGLNFPATDIPAQAREMYKINKVRLLYDRDQPTARMVCRSQADLDRPLDLTFAYLRAMSPIHIIYLKNMGVRASMSISIIAFGQLWGLISCHSYGHHGARVSFPVRKMCRLLGETISRNIERLSYAARLHSKKLINTVSTPENPGGYIIAKAEDLLTLFDADFGVLSIGDEGRLLGHAENTTEVIAMMQYFRAQQSSQITHTSDIHTDLPDVRKRLGDFQGFSGLLLVPLSSHGKDFIVFFRKGQLKQVHWAGNPYEKVMKEGTKAYLEPRKSFKIWSETVAGKTRQWTDEQIETAAVLCLVYGKFIEVWRQKEAALKTSQLTNLLLSNASHEVRTPLNAIINYLELALDGQLDTETRENLTKSHQASKSLIYVINDLLDLTRHEAGNKLLSSEAFNLPQAVRDACVIYRSDAERKGLYFEIVEEQQLPQEVIGDERVLKQIVSNTVSNALKHTEAGGITIDLQRIGQTDQTLKLGISISDTGCGIPPAKLDKIFRDFEEFSTADDSTEAPAAGLGLAIVSRAVRTSKGQMKVESQVGKGSTFFFQIDFVLAAKDAPSLAGSPVTIKSSKMIDESRPKTLMSTPPLARRNSATSMNSTSTATSEIDSLVDALGHHAQNEVVNTKTIPSPGPIYPIVTPGQVPVEGSQVPLRSLRIDPMAASEQVTISNSSENGDFSHFAAKRPAAQTSTSARGPMIRARASQSPAPTSKIAGETYSVLVVEDDPVNRMIMHRRLTKDGHRVTLTVHGEDAHQTVRMRGGFDVILMDIQMPICDGWESSRRIRVYETEMESGSGNNRISPRQSPRRWASSLPVDITEPSVAQDQQNETSQKSIQHIPIIAVSASLTESQRTKILDAGMDGWILKPVDFARLGELFKGIRSTENRKANAYTPGAAAWEKGGWLRLE